MATNPPSQEQVKKNERTLENIPRVSRRSFIIEYSNKSILVPSIDDVEINPQTLKITVEDCSRVERKKITYYIGLRIITDSISWKLYRSEKDFSELHTKLVSKKRNILFPSSIKKKNEKITKETNGEYCLVSPRRKKPRSLTNSFKRPSRDNSPNNKGKEKVSISTVNLEDKTTTSSQISDSDFSESETKESIDQSNNIKPFNTLKPLKISSETQIQSPSESRLITNSFDNIDTHHNKFQRNSPEKNNEPRKYHRDRSLSPRGRRVFRQQRKGFNGERCNTEINLSSSQKSKLKKPLISIDKIQNPFQQESLSPRGLRRPILDPERHGKKKLIDEALSPRNNKTLPRNIHKTDTSLDIYSDKKILSEELNSSRVKFRRQKNLEIEPENNKSKPIEEPITPRGGEQTRNLREIRDTKISEYQNYINEILAYPELITSSLFRDFIDLTYNPSGFFMSRNCELRCSFQVQKEKDLYCVVYGGQIYVFKSMTAKSCLYAINLECADIDLAKQELGVISFEIGEDRGKKIYTFRSRVEHHAYEWILHCRKARIAHSNTYLLESLKLESESSNYSESETENNKFQIGVNEVMSLKSTKNVKSIVSLFDSPKPVLKPEDFVTTKDTESNVKYDDVGSLSAATKSKLFEKLCIEQISKWTFVYTFPLFTTPKEVFEQLKYRFMHPSKGLYATKISPEQTSIIKFFLIWIKEFWSDFQGNNALISDTIKFINNAKSIVPEDVVDQLTQLFLHIKKQVTEGNVLPTTTNIDTSSVHTPILPRFFGPNKFETFDISATELARQITLHSFQLWRNINLREFLYWNTKEQKKKSQNVTTLVDDFNHISRWAVNYILLGNTPKQRAYFLMHVIDILSHLQKMDNFHGTVGLLSAIEMSAVCRLKKTWDIVDKEHKELIEEIKALFSAVGNWKPYREILQKCMIPTIPYIGVFLSDLTFIDDGNDNTLGPNALINWGKCTLCSRVISDLRKLQQGAYPFRVVPEIQEHLQKVILMNEKQFYQKSLLLEPRGK